MSDNLNLYQNRLLASRKISRDRLIGTKVKTFKRALESSYNAAEVESNQREFKALITGIPTSPKIGKKRFATLLDNDCKVGDYVYWPENNSHWLISEHDSTEISIFQGAMQRALYQLKWKDPILDKVYNARACAKGPDETTISDGVKHAIQFDVVTNSLYLIVSARVEGVHLLKRYFELMVNGRKWHIEVVDDFTEPDLIYLQLLETPFDRDADTEDLVGGKNPAIFSAKSVLDGLTEVVLGTEVNFSPVLLRNDSVLHSEKIKILTTNCMLDGNLLTFNELGLSSVTVKFEDYNKSFTWKLEVSEEVEGAFLIREIMGSETIKTLSTNNYVMVNTVNGETQLDAGIWKYDGDYFTSTLDTNDLLTLKTKNKTGNTVITYTTGDFVVEKVIKVVPLFGGN